MELQDFTEKEQEQIKKGLSEANISGKEAGKKILDLVPQEWIQRIPFLSEVMLPPRPLKELPRSIRSFMKWLKRRESFRRRREKNSVPSLSLSLRRK